MIEGLKQFSNEMFDYNFVKKALGMPEIERIKIFMLGPEGTNIGNSAKEWSKAIGIYDKSEFIYCSTPIEEIEGANKAKEPGVFPVFVLCAVYNKLHDLYFSHEDCYFFLHYSCQPLDEMQLASREEVNEIPENWTIAAHPSPTILLSQVKNTICEANSNSHAANMCAAGLVDACITTESARRIYSLKKLHCFGSPVMLFTFGTTRYGVEILKGLINK